MAGPLLSTPSDAVAWLRPRGGGGRLCADSRRVGPGDVFLAWPGRRGDGRAHVAAALAAGAAVCVAEADGADAFAVLADPRVARLPGLQAAAGPLADAWFDHPSRALRVTAVTGTNGKTSTAWWLAQASTLLGERAAVVGTLGIGEPPVPRATDGAVDRAHSGRGDSAHDGRGSDAHDGRGSDAHDGRGGSGPDGPAEQFDSAPADDPDGSAALAPLQVNGLTTPDAPTLHGALRGFVDRGVAACAIEASSIGLAEHRLDGLHIDTAVFTNFTQDHLDYHGCMAAYWAAKESLFHWPRLRAAVVNVDDAQGAALAQLLRASALALWTVSLRDAAPAPARRAAGAAAVHALTAGPLRHDGDGWLGFDVREDGGAAVALRTRSVGRYNASNLLGVVAVLRARGVALADAAAAVARLGPVPGRLQRLAGGGVDVVVDYAHTPDALTQVLRALRPLADARGGALWCVFGCGGDRDAAKRAPMGAAAAQGADRVVVTSDNPRGEDPAAIVAQVLAGTGGGRAAVEARVDRADAVAAALAAAAPGDVVLLAGKGHETTQETAGVRRPFSDFAHARLALSRRPAQAAGRARSAA